MPLFQPRIALPVIWIVAAFLCPLRLFADEVDFDRDIQPILEERCSFCHGSEAQESDLRLDQRSSMLRGGDSGLATIVPGQPNKSYLIEVVSHLDPDNQMPPDEDKIPAEEIELLRKWIEQGAVVPGQMDRLDQPTSNHWAFQPVVRPAVPASASPNPVDAFLSKRLAQENLSFASQSEPRALLRRLTIVLTGLTPTLEETEDFLREYSKNPEVAYQQQVERLLDSPHFGERWAQHWLDVIRWAETNGSEANLYRKNAWVYRDYVIRSFNEDKPYDRFVQEQIAGDSMGAGEATGFLVAGPHVPAATVGQEPTAIRQARADRLDEIMQTVGASIMGVTMGCARCHNHKFDPISLRDYYAMTAVFQDIEFGGRQPEYGEDHPLQKRGEELWSQIREQRDALSKLGGWEENWGAYREIHFRPITTLGVRFQFKSPNVSLDELEVLGPDTGSSNLALLEGTELSGYPEGGNENRNPLERVNDGEYGTMAWRAKVDKDATEKPWVQFDFAQPQRVDHVRLSSNREYFYDTDYLDKKPNLPRYECDIQVLAQDGTWKPWVGTWYINKKLNQEHPDRKETLAEVQSLISLLAEEGPRPSFVGRFIPPKTTHVLLRGSPESPRDDVSPAGPELFDGNLGLDSEAAGAERRVAFAKWITRSENPLTARVFVNRIWHHVFGTGLVSTTSDFGEAGALPTHPKLLDWLAAELVEPTQPGVQPWSMKHIIRKLVMSQAFQQSSHPRADGLAIDADTALLWRFPPKRVEAEVIRDAILQASGVIDLRIGGRGYRIHNEKKTYAQWEVIDNHGPETWRRMLYQERMRRVDDQMFTAFDFPDCGQVRAKRPISTTPLQALNLLNSEFVMEQAQKIAERASSATGDPRMAIEACYQYVLGRVPAAEDIELCLELAEDGRLDLVCRALINSNEFAFLP